MCRAAIGQRERGAVSLSLAGSVAQETFAIATAWPVFIDQQVASASGLC
jgi:hypothetical protein